jgi:predicted nucleotidyltransferase
LKKLSVQKINDRLREARIDLDHIASGGGGVWLFGSRAVGCARRDSDWDLLVLTSSSVVEDRQKCGNVDVIYVALRNLETWAASELAAHVEEYGVRLDTGSPIEINAKPAAAAGRKKALVAVRSRFLDRVWVALRPSQLRCELLRLRRNAHRGWLLAEGSGVPPTALLDNAWSMASNPERAAILGSCQMAPRVYDACLAL